MIIPPALLSDNGMVRRYLGETGLGKTWAQPEPINCRLLTNSRKIVKRRTGEGAGEDIQSSGKLLLPVDLPLGSKVELDGQEYEIIDCYPVRSFALISHWEAVVE